MTVLLSSLSAGGWKYQCMATSSTSNIMVLSTNIASAFPEHLVSPFSLKWANKCCDTVQWFDVKQGVNFVG